MKKKRHTVKNTFITNENYEIVFLWKTIPGKIHDYKMLLKDELNNSINWNIPVFVDSAYVWMLKDFNQDTLINVSKKNWKVNKLSYEDKENNTILGSIRVKIENTIWHVKRLGIVSNKFRNRIHWDFRTVKLNLKHDSLLIACWLQNLHRILA